MTSDSHFNNGNPYGSTVGAASAEIDEQIQLPSGQSRGMTGQSRCGWHPDDCSRSRRLVRQRVRRVLCVSFSSIASGDGETGGQCERPNAARAFDAVYLRRGHHIDRYVVGWNIVDL